MQNIDRAVFFAAIRRTTFRGKIRPQQVEGLQRILDYWQSHWPAMPIEELAYLMATAYWESGRTLQPIEEGAETYSGAKLRAYQRKLRYYPWFGRGLVQCTWERNYRKFGISDPNKMLEWPTSLDVIFRGMIFGMFTGRKLAHYIRPPDHIDFVGARRIINGTDKAKSIADMADDFLDALRAAVVSGEGHPLSHKAKDIQQRLKTLGYAVGRVDGVIGEATTGAIAAFQKTNALSVTGKVDPATEQALFSEQAAASEVADARAQDDESDLANSRTIKNANETQAIVKGGAAIALPALLTGGLAGKLLVAGYIAFQAWQVWQRAQAVKEAKVDDHRNGLLLK